MNSEQHDTHDDSDHGAKDAMNNPSNNPLSGKSEEEKARKRAERQQKKEAKQQKAKAKAEAKHKDGAGRNKLTQKAHDRDEAEVVEAALAEVQADPPGSKKRRPTQQPKGYSPAYVEARWYQWWEQSGFFRAVNNANAPSFVMVIPPPNVTGALHIGHALTNSIQDTICRWKRMSGFNVLWLPGVDHAGIATQTMVERKLMNERNLTKHDLGREQFLNEVFEYKERYGGTICSQLRRLGSSLDWSRECFTMDASLSHSVNEAFVRLYEQGLIYRDIRLVNWCTRLNTAISDIEVDYIDVSPFSTIKVPGYEQPVRFGVLTSFAYELEDGNGEVVVATTRPETMLGDTAVAVHPEDSRYTLLHGKHVLHPFNGRLIPIITDAKLVDMNFGTGCVKITPAHDPNDFETGKRHNLSVVPCYGEDGHVNEEGGTLFKGMARFHAREAVVQALKERGLFRGEEGNEMRLGLCSRSKDVIEPLLKPQWWVRCSGMANAASAAVRNGDLQILPESMETTWFKWLDDIKDWCISRQLWWGHRVPAYYVQLDGQTTDDHGTTEEDMSRWVIGRTYDEARNKAQERFPGREFNLKQDEDVLDTWFSSGLFPFSTLGWPDDTLDLRDFYPNTMLETGHDILFFWVARMVMLGLQLMGKLPFHTVFLHAMVRDAHGRKMSKSFGNVIDPVQVIEGATLEQLHQLLDGASLGPKELEKAKQGQRRDFPNGIPECGTDALRFTLVAYTAQGRDVNLDVLRVQGYRHWCNKLWNATRFALMNLGDKFVASNCVDLSGADIVHRWILSRLNAAIQTTISAFERYEFSPGTTAIHSFWQYELCDVYIECIKPLLNEADEAEKQRIRDVLFSVLEYGLRLLHPLMPFLTEELWQSLPPQNGVTFPESIMLAWYPEPVESWPHPEDEQTMEEALKVTRSIRSVRANYSVTAKQKTDAYIHCRNTEIAAEIEATSSHIATLSSCSSVKVLDTGENAPEGCGVQVVDHTKTVSVQLKGVVNAEQEIAKLDKRIDNLEKQIKTLESQISKESYKDSTPDHVKQSDTEKLNRFKEEKSTAESTREDFHKLLHSSSY